MKSMGKDIGKYGNNTIVTSDKIEIEKLKTQQTQRNNQAAAFTTVFDTVARSFTSFLEYLTEREKTIRMEIEAEVETKKMKLRFFEIVSEEKIEMEKIRSDFQLKMASLSNESDNINLKRNIITRVIESINNWENEIKSYQLEFGKDSPNVSEMYDRLHELNLELLKFKLD